MIVLAPVHQFPQPFQILGGDIRIVPYLYPDHLRGLYHHEERIDQSIEIVTGIILTDEVGDNIPVAHVPGEGRFVLVHDLLLERKGHAGGRFGVRFGFDPLREVRFVAQHEEIEFPERIGLQQTAVGVGILDFNLDLERDRFRETGLVICHFIEHFYRPVRIQQVQFNPVLVCIQLVENRYNRSRVVDVEISGLFALEIAGHNIDTRGCIENGVVYESFEIYFGNDLFIGLQFRRHGEERHIGIDRDIPVQVRFDSRMNVFRSPDFADPLIISHIQIHGFGYQVGDWCDAVALLEGHGSSGVSLFGVFPEFKLATGPNQE